MRAVIKLSLLAAAFLGPPSAGGAQAQNGCGIPCQKCRAELGISVRSETRNTQMSVAQGMQFRQCLERRRAEDGKAKGRRS